MTERIIPLILLCGLLLLQGLNALHRVSSVTAHAGHGSYDQMFKRMESSGFSAQSSTPGDEKPSQSCDGLDHLLNPGFCAAGTYPFLLTHAPVDSHFLTPPARLSRFQQLGPPARAPPCIET